MKKTLLFLLATALVVSLFSQLPQGNATLSLTLQCTGGTANRSGISYNPNQNLYYSVNAGSGSYPIETFDGTTGAALASNSAGVSYRGAWWNPTLNQLEGNLYNSGGIRKQDLDGSFYALGTGTIILSNTAPDAQSCGDYDWVNDEFIYFYNGSIYRYDRTTNTLVATVAVTGLPTAIGNINSNTCAYTNVTGSEIGLYDYVNKAFYFIDRVTGAYVSTCQLPMSAPGAATFKMGFDNGYLWLYNSTTSQWEGYQTVLQCTSTSSTINPVACDSYTAPSGAVYTMSNTYMDTIPNSNMCDSIITINLTVNNSTSSTISPVSCGSYTAPSGAVYTMSNTYMDTIPNSSMCDSIITINLTVNNSTSSTISPVSCGSYTAPSGAVYTMSNTYMDTIPNSNMCDSVITINLTVVDVDVSTSLAGDTITSNDNDNGVTYQWLNCDSGYAVIAGATNQSYIAAINGNYAVEVTENGCVDTSACVTIVHQGLGELFNKGINIYPNPTNGVVNIDMGSYQGLINYELVSVEGKVIQSVKGVSNKKIQIDLGKESKGIYLLKLYNAEGVGVHRIIKE